MFSVIEMPNGNILTTVATVEEAVQFIENIESYVGYEDLKNVYGTTRRIQQELGINPQES